MCLRRRHNGQVMSDVSICLSWYVTVCVSEVQQRTDLFQSKTSSGKTSSKALGLWFLVHHQSTQLPAVIRTYVAGSQRWQDVCCNYGNWYAWTHTSPTVRALVASRVTLMMIQVMEILTVLRSPSPDPVHHRPSLHDVAALLYRPVPCSVYTILPNFSTIQIMLSTFLWTHRADLRTLQQTVV